MRGAMRRTARRVASARADACARFHAPAANLFASIIVGYTWIVPSSLFRPSAVLHRGHVFGDQLAGVLADDRRAEDAVAAGGGQHLDEAPRPRLGDRAVEVVEAVARHLDGDALRARLVLVQPDARDLGIGERAPRDHASSRRGY